MEDSLMNAGWGIPLNNPTPVHWWKPDNHRACDPDSALCFDGDRISEEGLYLDEACFACIQAVRGARGVLGGPETVVRDIEAEPIVPQCACQNCGCESEEGPIEITVTDTHAVLGPTLKRTENGTLRYTDEFLDATTRSFRERHPLSPYHARVAKMRAEYVHKITMILGRNGSRWNVECPQEDIDYRCRHCSAGDYGCVLFYLMNDGVDLSELLADGVVLNNPTFPLEVTISMTTTGSADDALDTVQIRPWNAYDEWDN